MRSGCPQVILGDRRDSSAGRTGRQWTAASFTTENLIISAQRPAPICTPDTPSWATTNAWKHLSFCAKYHRRSRRASNKFNVFLLLPPLSRNDRHRALCFISSVLKLIYQYITSFCYINLCSCIECTLYTI